MTRADSLGLPGARARLDSAAAWAGFSCQSSFAKITVPLLARSSRVGSARTSVMPNAESEGPRPRTAMLLVAVPLMINPAIRTLLPVATRIRVEIFKAWGDAGVGVGVGVGLGVVVGLGV